MKLQGRKPKIDKSWHIQTQNKERNVIGLTFDIGYLMGAADFQERMIEAIEKEGEFLSTDYIKQLIKNLKR